MRNIIQLRQITEERVPRIMPDSYIFFSARDYSWRAWKTKVARWAFGMLKRHGFLINECRETLSYKVANIDQRDVLETLLKSDMIAPYVLDRGLEKVYMGPAEFEKLLRTDDFVRHAPMSFMTDREFMGVKVIVLPWIEGIVPVPRGY